MNFRKYLGIIIWLTCFFCSPLNDVLWAQVKIGDNSRFINQDAIFEMESVNKGLLLPRVSLRSINDPSPLRSFTAGMLVYNTTTINDLNPGIYVCDGVKWIKANTPNSPIDTTAGQNVFWSLRGNASVTQNQFLGTTRSEPLIIKTDNNERMRITEQGRMGLGTPNPQATLHIKGQMMIDSLEPGNINTDRWLVADPGGGRVKVLSSTPFLSGPQSVLQVVASNGQSIFQTPASITDSNKILLYRNGVLISFTVNNITSIQSELPCSSGDQIRIIQFL